MADDGFTVTTTEEFTDSDEFFDYDALWKDFIHDFWRDILERFMPDLYDKTDLTREPEFLEKELRDMLAGSGLESQDTPKRFVDELMKIFLTDGGDEWVLLHIEIQGRGGENISRRMFGYYCLLFTHHDKNPTALAILTAKRPKKEGEPGIYSADVFGTTITYKYNVIKAYALTDEELMTSGTLADIFVYALKVADRHKRSDDKKFAYMKEILRTLKQKKFERKNRRVFITILERTIRISSENYRKELWHNEDEILKGGKSMAYKPARQEAYEREVAKKLLEMGTMTDEQIASITTLDIEMISAFREIVNNRSNRRQTNEANIS